MDFSNRLNDDVKSIRRKQAGVDARTHREVDRFCSEYQDWFAAQKKVGAKPIALLAEGDSWFRYPLGRAVISQLEGLLSVEILNLATHGDETGDMLSIKQQQRLINELKRGPAKRVKFDALLFSGGGNDLVGKDRFHKWLHPYEKGMSARDIINTKALNTAFAMIELNYNELIAIRDRHSPITHLLLNAYDFAIPNGRKACWLGPWMRPGLKIRKIPVSLRAEVVKIFLQEFAKFLAKIAEQNKLVTVVGTQGNLVKKEWANELHPKNKGFKKIAKVFENQLKTLGLL